MYCAIETSFDETGIACANAAGEITSALLSSQVELHQPYRGVVPELAARTHLSDLPQLWRTLPEDDIAALRYLGITAGPGLPGCLLAGINFSRGVARALKVPLYGLNHLSGHLFSPFMPGATEPVELRFPHIGLLISGGHTELFLVRSLTDIQLLGQTLDDAVGELLDKVSAMLGYGYPGGAKLESLAREYDGITDAADYDGEYKLPLPMRASHDLNFSYSGLKTAALRVIRGPAGGTEVLLPQAQHASLLAALFATVAQSLWIKLRDALAEHPVDLVTVSGGVAINGFIRCRLQRELDAAGLQAAFPQRRHCLDNAEMMAWLLKLTVDEGLPPEPFDARSNWLPGSYSAPLRCRSRNRRWRG
jgi:N6-L-threonylcarbamoyladenine synthase